MKVSVVIPAFNAEPYIGDTLESVLRQSKAAHEVLVIDDGSTDGTEGLVATFGTRVQLIRQTRHGVSKARNAGIVRSTGELIAFVDADDRWEPRKLEVQIAAMVAHPHALWSFCWYYEFGSSTRVPDVPQLLRGGTYDPELISPDVTVLPSGAMVRASAHARFPEWSGDNEDAVYFNDLLQEGPFVFLDERLFGYRKHSHSAQKQPGSVARACHTMLAWADRHPAEKAARLRLKVLHALARQAEVAKWKRAWSDFHVIRDFCLARWPPSEPPPAVLTETLWPRFVYRLKDGMETLTRQLNDGPAGGRPHQRTR